MDKNLYNIVKKFKIIGEPNYIERYGNGHINVTYLVKTEKKDYILQKINTNIFKDVDSLMNNIYNVTKFLFDNSIESMVVVKTIDDKLFYSNANGSYRIYDFVMHSICYEQIESLNSVALNAEAFANFHNSLKKFDAKKLNETIPNFHNTPLRFKNLLNAIELADKEKIDDCQKEINLALSFKNDISRIMDGLNDKSINYTITHNDPKINNILFDSESGQFRCIIDLDTVMPGSILFDIGDSFRSMFTGSYEDSTNLDNLYVHFDIFDTYVKQYLASNPSINEKEKSLIAYSAFLLTYECGIRFLEDYLRGNVYFHVKYPEHNLIRARTQLKLANEIYSNLDKLNSIVKKY